MNAIVKPRYTAQVSVKRSPKDGLDLANGAWGLPRAKIAAAKILARPALVKPLIQTLLSDDDLLRQRASDTVRRVSERQPALLEPHAETLIGAFSESSRDNWRTRAHLGLVAARVAHTRSQRQRAAGLLMPLYYDPSNVVRCTAIEGLGLLARHEPSLRPQFEAIAQEAMLRGTLAMRNRAEHALARLSSERQH
jgi:HEAT repeat protein